MNVTKLDIVMPKFTEENLENELEGLGLSRDNYFFAMTKPSLLSRALIGNIVDFANRYAVISVSEEALNLVMLSRLDNKKITEVITIDREEIKNVKMSDILISYMLGLKTDDSKMSFQVFKKFGKFNKVKDGIDLFKQIYIIK